jgi:PKD repeat protein
MTVTILPPPTINAGPDQIKCANEDSVHLTGSVMNAGGVWTTSGSGTFFPDSITANAVYLISDADTAAGLVTLTVTTTGSCMLLEDSLQISITPPPTASFTNTEVCRNSITDFTDQSSGTVVSWDWDFGNGNTSNVHNPSFVFDSSGTNNVTLIVTALNGCKDTLTKPVSVNPAPFADFLADDVCQVDTVYFLDQSTATSPDFIVSYQWDFGDAGSSTLQNPTHIYPTFGSYLVTLIVESSSGCSDTIQNVVTVSPSPIANFSMDNNLVSTEQTANFSDLSSGSGNIPDTIQIISWDWDFYYESNGIDSSSSLQNPSFLYSDTGQYIVQLIVTNEYNCTDTVYNDITVHLEPLVPSGFSPDGNLENDILYVLGGPFTELDFVIYNEWGEIIFVSERQSHGWDGTKDGIKQPMGVYVYNVHATGLDGKLHHLWGDVTLLR